MTALFSEGMTLGLLHVKARRLLNKLEGLNLEND